MDEVTPLRLVLQTGGFTVDLTRPDMVFGRHTQANVRLPLPDVSRRHCRFIFRDGYWRVIDLDSLNGVRVNGELIKEAVLHDRDLVHIGGFHFIVELQASDRPAAIPTHGVIPTPDDLPKRKAS